MKKYALTLAEVTIALTILAFLGMLANKSLGIFLKKDHEIGSKSKHVIGTVSEVIDQLIQDNVMYPDRSGFANTYEATNSDNKSYGGPEKFRRLFKSKFNILEDNIKFGSNTIGDVPVYSVKNGREDKVIVANFSKLRCFKENKGVTYCLYDTCTDDNGKLTSCSNKKLSKIYIRIYLNNVDTSSRSTFDNDKALYIAVDRTGNIEVPKNLQVSSSWFIKCSKKTNQEENQVENQEENQEENLPITIGENSVHCKAFELLDRPMATEDEVRARQRRSDELDTRIQRKKLGL